MYDKVSLWILLSNGAKGTCFLYLSFKMCQLEPLSWSWLRNVHFSWKLNEKNISAYCGLKEIIHQTSIVHTHSELPFSVHALDRGENEVILFIKARNPFWRNYWHSVSFLFVSSCSTLVEDVKPKRRNWKEIRQPDSWPKAPVSNISFWGQYAAKQNESTPEH